MREEKSWKKKSIFLEVMMKIAYNNKPHTNVGRILFQPATQCNYVVMENTTHKQQAILMETIN